MRDFSYLCSRFHNTDIIMTGVTAKRNSVTCPKTAVSCGLTLSAAIQPEKRLGGHVDGDFAGKYYIICKMVRPFVWLSIPPGIVGPDLR